jgi:hypothetical protein
MSTGLSVREFKGEVLRLFGKNGDRSPEGQEARAGLGGCMNDHSKERSIYEKDNREKWEMVEFFKQKGDTAFRAKEFEEAKEQLRRALDTMLYFIPKGQAECQRFEDMETRLHLNQAATRIHLGQPRKALTKDLGYVLSRNPTHPKALYRKAKCHLLLEEEAEFESALVRLQAVLGEAGRAEWEPLEREFTQFKQQKDKWK